MFEVSLSHVLPNGTKKYKAASIEEAKRQGDAIFSDVKIPGGRNGGAPFRIVVTDKGDVVACRDLPEGEWKDAPPRGAFQEFPKMLNHNGRELIVHSLDEEERVLGITPAAEDGAESTKKGKSRGKA